MPRTMMEKLDVPIISIREEGLCDACMLVGPKAETNKGLRHRVLAPLVWSESGFWPPNDHGKKMPRSISEWRIIGLRSSTDGSFSSTSSPYGTIASTACAYPIQTLRFLYKNLSVQWRTLAINSWWGRICTIMGLQSVLPSILHILGICYSLM